MRGLATVVVSACLVGVAYVCACTSFGTDGAAVDPDAGATCAPPACGGAGGRCGTVSACGLEFSCGDCAPPYTCTGGTCTCTEPSGVCEAQAATCGEIDNGCGTGKSCGSCEAGTSCQTADGGLACASGTCAAESVAKTCSGKCIKGTNNCGSVVTCPECAGAKLCGADGKTNTCSCPARSVLLNQFTDGSRFCYSTNAICIGNFQATIAKIYPTGTEGVVRLYRCHKGISFLLTTDSKCNSLPGYLLDGAIGACAPAPACGALLLHRYYRAGNEDFIHGFGPTPPNYIPFGDVCYVWLP